MTRSAAKIGAKTGTETVDRTARSMKAQVIGTRSPGISGKENKGRIQHQEIDVDELLGGSRSKASPVFASKTRNYHGSRLADKTNLSSPRIRSPLIPKADLQKPTKSIEPPPRRQPNPLLAAATGRNLGLDRPLHRGTASRSNLRKQVEVECDSGSEEHSSEASDEDDESLWPSRITERYGPASFGKDKRDGSKREQMSCKDDSNEGHVQAFQRVRDLEDLDASQSDIDPEKTLEAEDPMETHFLRPMKTPQEVHEQISQRNIALTAAQEHQIQEITENLNPLCKSVQKLYIKFAKDTQLNMTRQRDMYEKAIGVEIQDLSGFINAFEQTSSEIDNQIKTVRGELQKSLGKKKTILEEGRKALKKTESRQQKQMQAIQREFDDLYDTYREKLENLDDPDDRRRFMDKRTAKIMMAMT